MDNDIGIPISSLDPNTSVALFHKALKVCFFNDPCKKYIFYSLVYSVKNLNALLVPIVMPAGGTPLPLEDFDVKVAIRRHFFSHLSNSHDKTNDHTERRKNLKMRLVQGPPSNKFEEEAS